MPCNRYSDLLFPIAGGTKKGQWTIVDSDVYEMLVKESVRLHLSQSYAIGQFRVEGKDRRLSQHLHRVVMVDEINKSQVVIGLIIRTGSPWTVGAVTSSKCS